MTTKQFLDFLKEKTEKMYNTAVAKNSDYSGSHADPFGNIDMCGKMGIATPEVGILVRMTDKLSRASTLIKRGVDTNKVKDESIEDTLVDLANYSLILAAKIKANRMKAEADMPKTVAPLDALQTIIATDLVEKPAIQ